MPEPRRRAAGERPLTATQQALASLGPGESAVHDVLREIYTHGGNTGDWTADTVEHQGDPDPPDHPE